MKRLLYIALVLSVILASCSEKKVSEINFYANVEDAPDIMIEDLTSKYKYDNQLRALIKAPVAQYFLKDKKNPKMEFPQGLDAVFYNEKKQPISTIHCKYAVYYEKTQLWKLSGDVVVVNPEGSTLRTQELYYDQNNQRIYSIKFVEVIDKKGNSIRGKGGFTSNMDFTEYEFKNVDGEILSYQKLEQK